MKNVAASGAFMQIIYILCHHRYMETFLQFRQQLMPTVRFHLQQLFPTFIVWFGEAVPEIETAIRYVEKADIFVIIGTSLNVYPAAGLLHYVPRGAEVYLIDLKPVDTHTSRSIHVIQKGASEGMGELKQLLGV